VPTVGASETSENRAACRRRGTASAAAATAVAAVAAAAAAGREAMSTSGLRRDHVRSRQHGEALARAMAPGCARSRCRAHEPIHGEVIDEPMPAVTARVAQHGRGHCRRPPRKHCQPISARVSRAVEDDVVPREPTRKSRIVQMSHRAVTALVLRFEVRDGRGLKLTREEPRGEEVSVDREQSCESVFVVIRASSKNGHTERSADWQRIRGWPSMILSAQSLSFPCSDSALR
jgi:hypothetical protein